jgi:hypothetical protein
VASAVPGSPTEVSTATSSTADRSAHAVPIGVRRFVMILPRRAAEAIVAMAGNLV